MIRIVQDLDRSERIVLHIYHKRIGVDVAQETLYQQSLTEV